MNCILCSEGKVERAATQMLWMVPVCDEHDAEMRKPFDLSREGTKLKCDHCHQLVEGSVHLCFEDKK